MFEDQTCLILGAGASRPYGFPTSSELRRILLGGHPALGVLKGLEVSNYTKVLQEIEADLLKAAGSTKDVERFRLEFGESQRVSIDTFLSERHEDFGNVGRGGIASVILHCEREKQLDSGWYQWLLEFLLAKGRDFPAGRLSVITFNYDRSLQFYLWRAFLRSFKLSVTEAAERVNRIKFIHAYGSVGPLEMFDPERAIVYGDTSMASTSAKGIKLVMPRSLPDTTTRMRELIAKSDRLMFLGFGFWTDNLEVLLDPSNLESGVSNMHGMLSNIPAQHWYWKRVFASCYRLPRSIVKQVNDRIGYWVREYHDGRKERAPIVDWGTSDQTIDDFVTHWDMRAKPERGVKP